MSRQIQTEPIPWCPECGGVMRLQRPPEGQYWEAFWCCIDFPLCMGRRSIMPDGTPEFSTAELELADEKDAL